MDKIKNFYVDEGFFLSSPDKSPLEETRHALFAINLIEDMVQDMIFYNDAKLKPINKIYGCLEDKLKDIYAFIKPYCSAKP